MNNNVLPELGPTSTRLLKFLKEKGALESFVKQCRSFNDFIENQDSDRPDRFWNPYVGGFSWSTSIEGAIFWDRLSGEACRIGIYRNEQ